jgi:hypothetical protein
VADPTTPPHHRHQPTAGPLDTFRQRYNTARPHRALPQGRTPQQAYTALPEVIPTATTTHIFRIRHGTVDQFGKLTLRHGSRLHHLGIGRTHAPLSSHHIDPDRNY